MTYLDTHVVAWLFAGRTDLLPKTIRQLVEHERLLISPIVELELQYLFELGRTTEAASMVVQTLERQIGLEKCTLPFGQVVTTALGENWTRDPFDRMITAQARIRNSSLLTKDETILTNYENALWA
ncbi:MAG: PIN domain-containing protein [Acidobacteria bacterium]|nr:PIN domain-containing protein [Acidobacteriota bacterium]